MGDVSVDIDTVDDPELKELVEALLDKRLDERLRPPEYTGGDELPGSTE